MKNAQVFLRQETFIIFLERKAYKIKALCTAKAETQRRKALLKFFSIRIS